MLSLAIKLHSASPVEPHSRGRQEQERSQTPRELEKLAMLLAMTSIKRHLLCRINFISDSNKTVTIITIRYKQKTVYIETLNLTLKKRFMHSILLDKGEVMIVHQK